MMKAQEKAVQMAAQQEAAIVKVTRDRAVQIKATENPEPSTTHSTTKDLEAALVRADLARDLQVKAAQDKAATEMEQLWAKYQERLSSMAA